MGFLCLGHDGEVTLVGVVPVRFLVSILIANPINACCQLFRLLVGHSFSCLSVPSRLSILIKASFAFPGFLFCAYSISVVSLAM